MEENNNKCLHCKYFRKFSIKVTPESEKTDGYCSKRQKYKTLEDTCKGFTPREAN